MPVLVALQPKEVGGETSFPRAVIFDLDGTLIDSVDDVSITLNMVLRERGVPAFSEHDVKLLMGEGVIALIRKALRVRNVKIPDAELDRLKDRFLDIYCHDPVALTKAFPFAADVLSKLANQGISVGVCSNKAEKAARLILERLGLAQHVQAVVGTDSGFGQKPDPSPLLACASKLSVPKTEVVYVGDHHIDVETARAAKIPVIAVAFGYSGVSAESLGADRTIACFSELPTALRGLV